MALDNLALSFIVLGILLLLVEASSPGFFIGVPATVLIFIGILGLVIPDFFRSIWSPIIALLVGIPATIFTIRLYGALAPPQPPTTTVATSLIGKTGLVTREVVPDSLQGKVKIEYQTWSATAHDVIPEGVRVEVVGSEGVHVVVRPMATAQGGTKGGVAGGADRLGG